MLFVMLLALLNLIIFLIARLNLYFAGSWTLSYLLKSHTGIQFLSTNLWAFYKHALNFGILFNYCLKNNESKTKSLTKGVVTMALYYKTSSYNTEYYPITLPSSNLSIM